MLGGINDSFLWKVRAGCGMNEEEEDMKTVRRDGNRADRLGCL